MADGGSGVTEERDDVGGLSGALRSFLGIELPGARKTSHSCGASAYPSSRKPTTNFQQLHVTRLPLQLLQQLSTSHHPSSQLPLKLGIVSTCFLLVPSQCALRGPSWLLLYVFLFWVVAFDGMFY